MLFFVSVGMLFDPAVLVRELVEVLAVILIILFGKSLAALAIVLLFRYPVRTALTVSASLAQIGEFSFILAGLGVSLGLMRPEGQSLILAGALLSITLNPLLFGGIGAAERWLRARPRLLDALERSDAPSMELPSAVDEATLRGHVIVVGYGRVGGTIGSALAREGVSYVVVEQDRLTVEALRRRGVPALYGDETRPGILAQAHPERARLLVVAAPDPYQARQIVELARRANPDIATVVRTHSAGEQTYLEGVGVDRAVLGERELALGMAHYALRSIGRSEAETDAAIQAVRTGEGVAASAGGAPSAVHTTEATEASAPPGP